MRRLLRCMVVLMLLTGAWANHTVTAQHHIRTFGQGNKNVSVLLGYGDGFTQKVALDCCVLDNWFNGRGSMGLGVAVGNCLDKHWDRLSAEVTATLHYQFVERLDTYIAVGAGGGYKWYDKNHGKNKGFFSWSTNAGARWYFSHRFALNLEAGYTFGSYILAGVSLRF